MVPDKGCLPGTRQNTLEKMSEWINDTSQSRVLFLLGGAGTGKSAIAHTIARLFSNRLGAFFRFDRNHLATNQVHLFFSSIMNKLANWDKDFRHGLLSKYKKGSFQTMTHDTQWRMFVEAAIHLKDGIVGPVLLVIDALDESGDDDSRQSLLHFLTEHAAWLPSNFRIIVTSRPERDINEAKQDNIKWMDLKDQKDEAKKDLAIYLKHQLRAKPGDNLSKSAYEQLAEMADGLFQWAFTACQFMKQMGRGLTLEDRFTKFFAMVPGVRKDLDDLYSFILGEKFKLDDPTVKKRFTIVLGQILGAAQPLSCNTLHALHTTENGSNINEVKLIVEELGSVLSGVAMDNEPIRPYHKSFRDFLTDKNRSGKWYIDVDNANHSMALDCFHTMNAGLHFNLCNLPSSFLSNKEMLPLIVEKEVIAEPLKYACQFWEFHLKNTPGQSLCEVIVTFVDENLLFWFEALSVLQLLNIAAPALSKLADLLDPSIAGTISLLRDADKFLHYFATAITCSAPHIYISALPFIPKCSPLAQTYGSRFKGGISLLKGQLPSWPAELARLTGHRGSISCIAFSHDGKRIVSGSHDKTIRIWDAETGQNVGDPLTGHTEWVQSVAFSHDGKQIVSGSADKTIQIWDVETGQNVGDPLIVHTYLFMSVAFSHDGKRIVSGSDDETIQIWDAETGQNVGDPLIGHTGRVLSVAFSHDGKRIVSGSNDKTIQIWDAETGQNVGDPLTGHTDSVQSVAFSHDDKQIVSGSHDKTIRIWDAETGQNVGDPLTGHTDRVQSVAFSHDGKQIVSGSCDNTIRIWDAETGQNVGGPLTGHSSWVLSVAFSHDGKRIVSGSCDNTIRIWDAEAGQNVGDPLTVHTDSVLSVAFSHDGKRIVSGSRDNTIWIWDAETGQNVGDPLTGHTDLVLSVAFSHDGKQIVSGSGDKTIQIWDAETGQNVGDPLTGHSDLVQSVAFSHDGKRIVSGSRDKTIRIWDAETGQNVGGPLTGHTFWVESVAFSHDGKQIVSGSRDKTIRIWDAETGQNVGDPLTVDTNWVLSVAFSHDGKRITIRIWDAETGQNVGDPLTGHTDLVQSVAFTHDYKQMVPSSAENTIHIWDAETGQNVGDPLTGHTDWVQSAAFPQDGKQIVYGSNDKTIHIWGAETGKNVSDPLPQHAGLVDLPLGGYPVIPASYANVHQTTSSQISLLDVLVFTQEGWIYGKEKKLLLWVPPFHRPGFHWRYNLQVLGAHETILDLRHIAWGEQWTQVKGPK
ncbi:hypothetical protein M422DRAFT_165567 [Sphaerobolus stellatus SS14]|uniref:NACHT domain-containing protein n=1 Tax=Sphaerobolus stellatus (strain SS14) TaxID=990650 RepID=A0A0C9UTP6_SPHS4|nr:hypothetical protein M422DRAFT_165567 [Sphaerobolus stellatus SS14]